MKQLLTSNFVGGGGGGKNRDETNNEDVDEFVSSIVENIGDLSGNEDNEIRSKPPKNAKTLIMYGAANDRLQLLPENYNFPQLTLCSLVTGWYCGNQPKGIPPYKILKACDVQHLKGGKQKLSHFKKLMQAVEKAARIVNQPQLVKRVMSERDAITLYNNVKHLFHIPAEHKKARRYETLSWKSYYNLLVQRKWRLYSEKDEQGAQ